MKILVIGGTRYFGIHMIEELLRNGHDVTIATRGNNKYKFQNDVSNVIIERTDSNSLANAFKGKYFDIVYDKIAYCSNDIKYLLENICCGKYILMSSAAVYDNKCENMCESYFDPTKKEFVWCNRQDYDYGTVKQYAECAVFQTYSAFNSIAVRYPVVLGKNDYTQRLKFYVEHVKNRLPMHIDNIDAQMCYINEKEAGNFLAYLCESEFSGVINGCSDNTISIRQILDYIKNKTKNVPILETTGDISPFNGESQYSLNTSRAKNLGFTFSNLNDWIFNLIDYYLL